MRYALDTNAIILFLREDPRIREKFDAAVGRGDEIAVPPLVHFEVLRGFMCKPAPKKEKTYQLMIGHFPVRELSVESLERGASIYANLYRARRTVDDVDLLIAAYCIVGGYVLVTNNTKHFKVIGGLMLEDWSAS